VISNISYDFCQLTNIRLGYKGDKARVGLKNFNAVGFILPRNSINCFSKSDCQVSYIQFNPLVIRAQLINFLLINF